MHIFNKYEIFVWFKLACSLGMRTKVTQLGPNLRMMVYSEGKEFRKTLITSRLLIPTSLTDATLSFIKLKKAESI